MDVHNTIGGSLQISTEVIAKIARLAALEVDGVSDVATGTSQNVRSLLGRTGLQKPVTVVMEGNKEYRCAEGDHIKNQNINDPSDEFGHDDLKPSDRLGIEKISTVIPFFPGNRNRSEHHGVDSGQKHKVQKRETGCANLHSNQFLFLFILI